MYNHTAMRDHSKADVGRSADGPSDIESARAIAAQRHSPGTLQWFASHSRESKLRSQNGPEPR
jgi:hypothetical protein